MKYGIGNMLLFSPQIYTDFNIVKEKKTSLNIELSQTSNTQMERY